VHALLPVLLVACTINGRGPDPVTQPHAPDPDRMPAELLDKQDPSVIIPRDPPRPKSALLEMFSGAEPNVRLFGCIGLRCNTGHDGDASGALIVIAALVATRRRNRS
jgi:hypothetical protein